MTLLDRYIGRTVIGATLWVALAILAIQSFMNLIAEIPAIHKDADHFWGAFLFVFIRLPSDLYQLFPIVSFLGCLLGLGNLASSHQLTAMGAGGISQARIMGAVIQNAVGLMLIMTIIGEYIGPTLEKQAEHWPSIRSLPLVYRRDASDIWLKEGNAFIHIGAAPSDQEIRDIIRFGVDDHFRLKSIAYAARGLYQNQQWVLQEVTETVLFDDHMATVHKEHLPLHIVFNPLLWQQGRRVAYRQPLTMLYRQIQYRQQAGLNSKPEQLVFWQRIFQPMLTILMFCLAAPFIFGSLRSVTIGARMISGVGLGFLFYVLNQSCAPLAMLYAIPPLYAACAPAVLFGGICVILLRFSTRFLHARAQYRNQ